MTNSSDQLLKRLSDSWSQGDPIPVEQLFDTVLQLPTDLNLLLDLICQEIALRELHGQAPNLGEYQQRFPTLARELQIQWSINRLVDDGTSTVSIDKETDTGSFHETSFAMLASVPLADSRYQLRNEIGRGAIGIVYEAWDTVLKRKVAIKRLRSGLDASETELRRMRSEAEAIAAISHPNIVQIYDFIENHGTPLLAVEYCSGGTLGEMLAGTPLPPRQAAEMILQIADGVAAAHQARVLHRDLKPTNILLEGPECRVPKITDFGLAKLLDADIGATATGCLLGTPTYMAPEQSLGQNERLTPACDIYSIGAILYECLTGRPPIQGSTVIETIEQLRNKEPVAVRQLVPRVPIDLETIAHKCLRKNPQQRYGTARELAEDIQRFLSDRPIHARRVGQVTKTFQWCRRNPTRCVNGLGVVLVVAGLLVAWSLIQSREKEIIAQDEAKSLLDQLNVASELELPSIVEKARSKPKSMRLVSEQHEKESVGSDKRFRSAIVLLAKDSSMAPEICPHMLELEWNQWLWFRNQLNSFPEEVKKWTNENGVNSNQWNDSQYIRYMALQAAFSETPSPIDSERVIASLVDEVRRDPTQLVVAAKAVYPFRMNLLESLVYRTNAMAADENQDGPIAASIMVELYRKTDLRLFVSKCASARSDLFPILLRLREDADDMSAEMKRRIGETLEWNSWSEKTEVHRARAVYGAVLFGLDNVELVWPLLRYHENPSTRSFLIDWIPVLQRDPKRVIERIQLLLEERDQILERTTLKTTQQTSPNAWLRDNSSSELRSLILTLGNYPAGVLQRKASNSLWTRLENRFQQDPDAGVHSACEWILRRFRKEQFAKLVEARNTDLANDGAWFVTYNEHVMVSIQGPIQFQAGADADDPYRAGGKTVDPIDQTQEFWDEDRRHTKRIERSFAVAMHETRFSQMQVFDSRFHELQNKTLAPTLEHPACRVSWYKAAAYCNWLSDKAGIPSTEWCFQPNSQNEYAQGMTLSENYLHRTGFRLPTESEWEYACRAGTSSSRYFGDSDELLSRYVCYSRNSYDVRLQLPGTYKPNDLGLFDTFGNVLEWCLDPFDIRFPSTRFRELDQEWPLAVNSQRIQRGASLWSMPNTIRASEYYSNPPNYRDGHCGFRIARTVVRDR